MGGRRQVAQRQGGSVKLLGMVVAHIPHIHPNRRHVHHTVAIVLGAGCCVGGSALALNADAVLQVLPVHVPHALYDAFAYTVHAFGAVPVVAHGERLWNLVMEVPEE